LFGDADEVDGPPMLEPTFEPPALEDEPEIVDEPVDAPDPDVDLGFDLGDL
jgi:hypothetical protein